MKIVAHIAFLLTLVCLLNTSAVCQKRRHIPQTSSTASNKPLCMGDSIPKGFVVVGEKQSARCSEKLELVIKKPAATELICDGSPIPEDYTVVRQAASSACSNTNRNPLVNALSIIHNGEVPINKPSTNRTRTSSARSTDDDEEGTEYVVRRRNVDRVVSSKESDPDRTVSSSLSSNPTREEIDIAIRRSTVLIGMDMQDVSRAWGTTHTSDSLVEDSGVIYIWGYRRGRVYFRDGIVYKVMLLKG